MRKWTQVNLSGTAIITCLLPSQAIELEAVFVFQVQPCMDTGAGHACMNLRMYPYMGGAPVHEQNSGKAVVSTKCGFANGAC